MRRLFIVLCVAAIVPLAAQISELLNSGLPPWIRLGGEERLRFEGFMNSGFRDGNNDLYLLQRFRFSMRLLPTSWLKFHFQLQDVRVWWKDLKPYAPPYENTWDHRWTHIVTRGQLGLTIPNRIC